MNTVCKSVAMLLAIVLLAAPAAALSNCWTGASEAQHGCTPGCPMMASMPAHNAAGAVQAIAARPSCCDISSAKPKPATQLQVPTDNSRTAVMPPLSMVAFAAVVVPFRTDSPPSMPPLPAASPQAVFCTFIV